MFVFLSFPSLFPYLYDLNLSVSVSVSVSLSLSLSVVEISAKYVETSAKTGYNIDFLFMMIAEDFVNVTRNKVQANKGERKGDMECSASFILLVISCDNYNWCL